MPQNLPHVRPGDLITAAFMNAVLDQLDQLQAQIDALGGGSSSPLGPPVILALQPSDQAPVGSELVVLGGGFGTSSENNVTIANLPALVLGGGGTQLRVRVPTFPGVPAGGTPTQITVSNPRGFASLPMRVMPAVLTTPEGQLFATMTASPGGVIAEGTSVDFVFSLRAVVNLEETYTLTPLLNAESLPGQWQARTLDAGDNQISSITIPAGQPPDGVVRQVRVRVTVPAGTDGTSAGLSLTIRSQRNTALVATSPTFTIDVGGAAPQPEQLTVTVQAVQNGSVDPDGTVVARPSTTRVTFSVAGTQNGVAYTVSLGNVPAGWTAQPVGGANHTATGSQLTFRADFTPGGGAAATTFAVRVARQDDNSVFGTRALAVRPQ